jgi:putative component of membrane protein insertase Oxa1/YidC/SpoIIIJ protein YidD
LQLFGKAFAPADGCIEAACMIARLLMAVVKAYRLLLSPSLGSSCRFEPTCSVYAIGALQVHGAAQRQLSGAWPNCALSSLV